MWQGYRISDKCDKEFNESVISNPNIINSDTDYSVMMIYGKSGSCKSTCINLYMRNEILMTGINDDGISKGIYLCKRNDLLILDTEGVGTDNRGCDRYDIVTLFCISSCFVILQPISTRFPEGDIIQTIEEILIVFERIVKVNPSNQNRPSFLILLTIVNPVSQERFQQYTKKANEFINGELFNRVRNYFFRVNAKVLPPLDERARKILTDTEKISHNDVSLDYLREIDSAFQVALQSSNKKKGSNFKSLNILLSLAKENRSFDPLIIERANNTLLPLINREFLNPKKCYSGANIFLSFIKQCEENIKNEIKRISLCDSDKTCFLKIFEKGFKSRKEIEITNFNYYMSENLPRVADSEFNEILGKITGNETFDYSNFNTALNLSRKKIEECKLLETSDFQFLNKFRMIKDQQLSKLHKNNFEEKFIEFRVIKPTCLNFYKSNLSKLEKTKPIYVPDQIKTLQNKCKSELEIKIKDHQSKNNHAINYSLSSTDISLINKYSYSYCKEISDYYHKTYEQKHHEAVEKIRIERKSFSTKVNQIISRAGAYCARTLDDFKDESDAFERNLNRSLQDLFSVYYDDITKDIYSYYDLISSSVVRTCITLADSFICPRCGNLWEKRVEASIDSYLGCGNFTCHGKTIGCNGTRFRTPMKVGDTNNSIATSISYQEIIARYPEVQNIANGANSALRSYRK